MIQSLLYLLGAMLVLGLLWFAADFIGTKFGAPEWMRNAFKGVIALVGLIVIINFILVLTGQPGFLPGFSSGTRLR